MEMQRQCIKISRLLANIAIITLSNKPNHGPQHAQRIPFEVEEAFNEIGPVVVVNRILCGDTDCARMKKALPILSHWFKHLGSLCSRLLTACWT
jgi:hypothetical protein